MALNNDSIAVLLESLPDTSYKKYISDKPVKLSEEMSAALGSIYLAVNVTNGDMYVGQTRRAFSKRLSGHKYAAKSSDGRFQRAIRKYGWGAFSWVVIDEALEEELNDLEAEYIAYYRSIGKHLYNETDGGGGKCGYQHTEETKQKISKSNTGRVHTLEARRRMSDTRKGKSVGGVSKHSEETKRRISTAGVGNEYNAKQWSTTLVAPDGTTYNNIFNLRKFAKEAGLNPDSMYRVVAGKQLQHKGWTCISSEQIPEYLE